MTREENAIKHNHNFDFRTLPPKPAQAEPPKEAGWVKTSERLPRDDEIPEEDNGMVMCAYLVTGVTIKPFYAFDLTRANAIRTNPGYHAYWMLMPKLPEVEL